MVRSLCRIRPLVCSRGPTGQGARSTDDNFGLIDVVVTVGDVDDTEGLEELRGHGPTGCGARVLTCYLGEWGARMSNRNGGRIYDEEQTLKNSV